MEVAVKGPVRVSKGQIVDIHARLRGQEKYAFCQVYSTCDDSDPGPHIEDDSIGDLRGGMPQFVSPTILRLDIETQPRAKVRLVAQEDLDFYLFQDIDVEGDPLVKARIVRHGPARTTAKSILEAIGRLHRRFFGPICGSDEEVHRGARNG